MSSPSSFSLSIESNKPSSSMDLGCLDLGCINVSSDKRSSNDDVIDSLRKEEDSTETSSASKFGKKSPKEKLQSAVTALNRLTSQIKKPPRRKTSPLNWFPRQKMDSYLKRKIKMLQELDGMNLTLDETLDDSSPHYCKVLREKMAAKEAAHKAMEAQKAALVEASWCRILRAARIQRKEAEDLLLESEKAAAEAIEAARVMGVIMYDRPSCHQKPCQVETNTLAVTASFETAFDVDKEVAVAVKTAFVRLASCSSFSKDEFRDLLRKISENPDTGNVSCNEEIPELSSEYELESGSEVESIFQADCVDSKQRKKKRSRSFEKLTMEKLINMMVVRIQCLNEDELSSLATIVATCGLNAALASASCLNSSRRMSGAVIHSNLEGHADNGQMIKAQAESELPSLDKFLVKHVSRLEKEVQEAKNNAREISCKKDKSMVTSEPVPDLGSMFIKHTSKFQTEIEEAKKKAGTDFNTNCKKNTSKDREAVPDLGTVLMKKNCSRLEKEVEESKKNCGKSYEYVKRTSRAVSDTAVPSLDKLLVKHGSMEKNCSRPNKEAEESKKNCVKTYEYVKRTSRAVSDTEVPSLDKFLVKRVSRLEKEVQEAKSKRDETNRCDLIEQPEKENVNLNKEDSLDKILVKKPPVHAVSSRTNYDNLKPTQREKTSYESLDKVLVKHVSRLEKEKMRSKANEDDELNMVKCGNTKANTTTPNNGEGGGLDQIMVKHKSRLEREKSEPQVEDRTRFSVSRRQARERELQEAWGGLGLGNSIQPHISRLESEKAAWIKAEEEGRKPVVKQL